MKTLLIARHGKSSWVTSDIKDIDRSLDISGIEGAYQVSDSLLRAETKLDLLISSPATRAIHTALIHSRTLGFPEEQIRIFSSLYYKGHKNVLDLVSNKDSAHSTIMVCGHNPTSTELANLFLPIPINNLQTSGVVSLSFHIETWDEIKKSSPIKATYFKRKEKQELI